jgi:hypothetical protein
MRRTRNIYLYTTELRQIKDDDTLEIWRKSRMSYISRSLSGHRLSVSLQITIVPEEAQFIAEIPCTRRNITGAASNGLLQPVKDRFEIQGAGSAVHSLSRCGKCSRTTWKNR